MLLLKSWKENIFISLGIFYFSEPTWGFPYIAAKMWLLFCFIFFTFNAIAEKERVLSQDTLRTTDQLLWCSEWCGESLVSGCHDPSLFQDSCSQAWVLVRLAFVHVPPCVWP